MPAESILIVEDDAGVARLEQVRLERAGYAVACAATAADARAALAGRAFDLVVLDYRLPDAPDGVALYRDLKAGGLDLPVVMVTGLGDERVILDALRAGVHDFVAKSPAYLDYLPEAVRRGLDQATNARERRRAEAELRATNETLGAMLEKLTAQSEELRATTQQLWQAAKLASIGELAASVAHELNNPLGIISLRLEAVLARTAADDPRRAALEVVEGEVERMARLIANLLTFSRQAPDRVSTVDLTDEARQTIGLIEYHLTRRAVTFRFDAAPALPPVLADRQKLRQVFLNLYTNAADAMTAGGTLTTRLFPTADNRAVVVEVADTGTGIPPDVLPNVFDPFFTTKEDGKGTGLGLAICKRIITDHKGTIRVESESGKGTTVRITLPVGGAPTPR